LHRNRPTGNAASTVAFIQQLTLIIIIRRVEWILNAFIPLSPTYVLVRVVAHLLVLHVILNFKVLLLLKFVVIYSLFELIILVLHLFILVKIIVINVKNILLINWLNEERRLLLQTFIWGSFSSCFLTLSSFFDVFFLIFFFAHVFMHYFWRTKELSFCWSLVILELHYTRRYYSFPLIHFIHRVVVHHTHLIDSRFSYKVLLWLYWYFANISEIAYLFIWIFVLCITFNSLMSNSLLWYISRRLYIFFHEISIHMACRRKHLSLTRMPISILKILFLKIHINI